ncbi:MAG: pitrilysin family protein [Parvibaculum sp.]
MTYPMKSMMIAVMALVSVLLVARAEAAVTIQEVTSPGGITAWLVEEHALPLIVLDASWSGGTLQDPEGKEGLAYMMSALLDEGAGDLDSQSFQSRLEELAVELRFRASPDNLALSFKTLTQNQETAFGLLRLALSEPRFDEEAVERIRRQLLVAITRDMESPDRMAAEAWYHSALPGHAYTRPSKGTLESVAALTRTDLAAHQRNLMVRQNLSITVVGDIDAESLKTLLDQTFGSLAADSQLPEIATASVVPTAKLEIIQREMPQSIVLFGHEGIARDDEDFIPAYVMNYVLGGGGFSSRLMTEVREKRGLAYSVASYFYPLTHASLFIGQVATENTRVAESIEVIRAELVRLAQEGVTDEELQDTKTYLTGSYPLRFDTNEKIASQLVAIQEEGLGIDYITKRNSLIEAVTADDVRRVAARLLRPDNLIITIVGQPEGLDATEGPDATESLDAVEATSED